MTESLTASLVEHKKPTSGLMNLLPFYFGWWILGAASIGRIMTIPGQTIGVSSFLDPLIEGLQLDRSVISTLYAVGTVSASLLLTQVGRWVDRRGPQFSVVLISTCLVLSCFWMSLAQGAVMVLIGFFLLRLLGHGALTLVNLQVINYWFVRRRGLALGIASLGFALGNTLFPLLIEHWVSQVGWRWAYILVGLVVGLTILPVGALIFRNKPEIYGLQPDGMATTASSEVQVPVAERNLTFREARTTLAFWLFALSDALVVALATGLLFHHYSVLGEQLVDRTTAALFFLPLGAVTAAANVITGLAMDRVQPRYLLAGLMALLCICLGFSTQVDTLPETLIYGTLMGAVIGIRGVLDGGIYAYYFGRLEIGAIRGLASTISVGATAVGPPLLAVGYQLMGSYVPILWICTLPPLILAGILLALKLESLQMPSLEQ